MNYIRGLLVAITLCLLTSSVYADQAPSFRTQVGSVAVGTMLQSLPYDLPFITWGGDIVTFYANGNSFTTAQNSNFALHNHHFHLVRSDDFVAQVKNYLAGKTPWLRATLGQLAAASEVLGSDPRTKPVVVLQLTWSAGDHLVARSGLTLSSLRGKKIAAMLSGPHIELLNDVLLTAHLTWNDVNVVWVKELTGPNGPAALLKRGAVDACTVITPDMIALTGGPESIGTGAEGSVKGARVLISTATLSHSIADVYAVRKDWYDANQSSVTNFVAAWLKAAETIADAKKAKGAVYRQSLEFAVKAFANPDIKTATDVDGLFADCSLPGYPGNVAFFTNTASAASFASKTRELLAPARDAGYASSPQAPLAPTFTWSDVVRLGNLNKTMMTKSPRFDVEVVADELEQLNRSGTIDDKMKYEFSVQFSPNQQEFSATQYAAQFDEVLKLSAKYGNAVIAIRGHADPTKTLGTLVKACETKGALSKRTDTTGKWHYYLKDGSELKLETTKEVVRLIEAGYCDGDPGNNPRQYFTAAFNLSRERAQMVLKALLAYAGNKGTRVDPSQIQAVGVGIAEPVVPRPQSMDDVAKNTRVQFALIAVKPEAVKPSDFEF